MLNSFAAVRRWTAEELEKSRQDATADFVRERLEEGADLYQPILRDCTAAVRELFQVTSNLLDLGSGAAFSSSPHLLTPARYLGGPPISSDDLDVLADENVAERKRLDSRLARMASEVVESALDRTRFPWLFSTPRRDPSLQELEVAIGWTAGLWAAQATQTQRRGAQAARQENAVSNVLQSCGFERVAVKDIDFTARNMAPGQYCRETRVAGAKCDIPVMLRDSRLLLIECKVSNSSLNSIKRLVRETCGKADLWRNSFGERAVTAAVLSGVFKLRHLEQAQDEHGVAIFWERDLSDLESFLGSAL